MIERIIAFCLQQRLMVIGATLAIAVSGIIAFEELAGTGFSRRAKRFCTGCDPISRSGAGRSGKTYIVAD